MTTRPDPEIVEAARAFVTASFLYTRPDVRLLPDEPLLGNGVVDSLGVMELVEWIESTYDVCVDDGEITEENFGTLAAVARYVGSKRALQAA
jgi:acyl carrier protein